MIQKMGIRLGLGNPRDKQQRNRKQAGGQGFWG
jgi:hypothetical protein